MFVRWPTSPEKRGSNGNLYIRAKITTDKANFSQQGTLKYLFASASFRLSTSHLNPKEPYILLQEKDHCIQISASDFQKYLLC